MSGALLEILYGESGTFALLGPAIPYPAKGQYKGSRPRRYQRPGGMASGRMEVQMQRQGTTHVGLHL